MAERFRLAPVITASSWNNLWGALWEAPPRGIVTDSDGTIAPKWTNREALAVVAGLRDVAKRGSSFPLWYQFAAGAYGWSPQADKLQRTQGQADRIYDPELSVLLNLEAQRITGDLDDLKIAGPRIELKDSAFTDLSSDTEQALAQDGASASFKIPLPACKDPRTGKPAKPVKNPLTGKWECPGGVVTVDDPITAILKSLSKVAVPLMVVLIAIGAFSQNQRKKRKSRRS